jgi:hypothetical protein
MMQRYPHSSASRRSMIHVALTIFTSVFVKPFTLKYEYLHVRILWKENLSPRKLVPFDWLKPGIK